jgi:hypothetical protein
MTIVKFLAEDTTVEAHGHTLGLLSSVVASFCVLCKAGSGGMCLHCSQSLYIQLYHWAEGRPVEKPGTSDFCRWVQGGSTANAPSAIKPSSFLQCQKLPRSTSEAIYRKAATNTKRNATEGNSARYDVFGGDAKKREALGLPSKMFDGDRPAIKNLWAVLRKANTNQTDREPWEQCKDSGSWEGSNDVSNDD